MARLVIGIISIRGVNKPEVKSHLAGIVCGNEHLRLLFCIRQRSTSENSGVATLCKVHQFLYKFLLLRRRWNIMKNLMFLRTVNTNIFRCAIVRNLIIKCRQLGHFDKIAETLLLNQIVGDRELEVGGFLCEDSRPCVETADFLPFKLIRAKILE